MLSLVKIELIKIFKMKQIYLGLVGAVLFSLLIFLSYLDKPETSAFHFPISTLANLTMTYVIIVFLGFSSYIYGIEIQEKTLKILRGKVIPPWQVILTKFTVGVIYTFLLLFIVGVIVFVIASLFYPFTDFQVRGGNHWFPADQGLKYVMLAYLLQGLALVFVTFLCITLSVILDSPVIALISTFFIMVLSNLAQNVASVKLFLPTTHWLVWQKILMKEIFWQDVVISLGLLGFYSILLFILAVLVYRQKEVKL